MLCIQSVMKTIVKTDSQDISINGGNKKIKLLRNKTEI